MEVAADLTLPEDARVFVVGDLAAVIQDGKPVPGLAPAAMQMGRAAARNILRRVEGKAAEPFRYLDRGSFAVIGRGAAVGSIFSKLEVSGLIAWIVWLRIHLLFLVGLPQRIAVMFTWLYSYLTWRRVARLITFTPWLRRRAARGASSGTPGGAGAGRERATGPASRSARALRRQVRRSVRDHCAAPSMRLRGLEGDSLPSSSAMSQPLRSIMRQSMASRMSTSSISRAPRGPPGCARA